MRTYFLSAAMAFGVFAIGTPGFGEDISPVATPGHWAFRSPVRPVLPSVKRQDQVRTSIDRFILAELEKHGLALGPPADRATLLRRLSLDLLGLPPAPEDVAAFQGDTSPDAYERLVERFLASPHYGERWGKYWLDAAGYADSNGYFHADSDRPLAYRYRDYVVRSLNGDKPYDQFVREQLAGDELAGFEPNGDVTPLMAELLAATHFLRNAPDGTGESDGNPDEQRTDRFTVLEGTLQVTMNSLLGITIQCCRCHDHKFEPISQKEYYSLQAILHPAYCPDRWRKPQERLVPIASRAEREEHRRHTERIEQQVKALRDGLATMAGPLREQVVEERLASLEPQARAAVLAAFRAPKDKLISEQRALLKKHAQTLNVDDNALAKRFPEFDALRNQVAKLVAAREKDKPQPLEQISALTESDPNPPAHHVLVRGVHTAPGPEVPPGVPQALSAPGQDYRIDPQPPNRISTGRRLAFARWVTAPENPLFARVLVNRLWQYHFGTGLVTTPDNFGESGAKPSHPELLDHLTTEFTRSGWSMKALHRLIVSSAVYRQASALRDEAYRSDPDNRLLWRSPMRRLDAEAVRDAMLSISGELDARLAGPFIPSTRRGDGSVEIAEDRPGARRRSLYLQQRRTQVVTLLQLFDAPSVTVNCAIRPTSTVPLQALTLLNSEFARARARAFAQRLERDAGPDVESRISRAFRLVAARDPSNAERTVTETFLAEQERLYGKEQAGERAWTDLCQMLLASNTFLYVE